MWMLRYHARIQEFLLGLGSGQAGLPENSSDNVFLFFFSSRLILQAFQRVSNGYFKRNFPRFQREFNIFQGGGGGGGIGATDPP